MGSGRTSNHAGLETVVVDVQVGSLPILSSACHDDDGTVNQISFELLRGE